MENLKKLLAESASRCGKALTDSQLEAFMAYKSLLKEQNEKMNLTAITGDEEIIRKHFADSLSLFALDIESLENAKVIDIGTGAGFPGIPLKIASPAMELTLLDSLKKRCAFLELCVQSLNLENVRILAERAEDAGKNSELRESYDFAVSRAVAPMTVLLEYCLPFVRVGGYFLAMKGPAVFEEADSCENALKTLGGQLAEIKNVSLGGGAERYIAVVRKISETPKKYPRKAGKAAKSPIL